MLSYYFAIILLLTVKSILTIAGDVKDCNMHSLFDCPQIISKCSEKTLKCECISNYDFNQNYTNETDYCLLNPTKSKTIATSKTTNDIISSTSVANLYQKTITVTSIPPVGSHHIIGGILIPLIIVISVIGVAYGLKRLEIIRRFRDYQLRRRRQPFYEDVMMNHDNDDPPLI